MTASSNLSPPPFDDARLLTSRAYVAALARDLVRDSSRVDEWLGHAWLAAKSAPPHSGKSVRAWLGAIARNLVRREVRDRRRRESRERMAARSEVGPSPADIVAEEEARAKIVRVVLELEPSLRIVVLLRYWEGLGGAAIGRRLGLPATTIRDRLARAHERMRGALDDQQGDRATWHAALLPLVGTHLSVGGASFISLGWWLMNGKLVVPVAAVAVALLSVWWAIRDPENLAAEPATVEAESNPSVRTPVVATTTTPPTERNREIADVGLTANGKADSLAASSSLRVIDGVTRQPVPRAEVRFIHAVTDLESQRRQRDPNYLLEEFDIERDALREGVAAATDEQGDVALPAFDRYLTVWAKHGDRSGWLSIESASELPFVIELVARPSVELQGVIATRNDAPTAAGLPLAISWVDPRFDRIHVVRRGVTDARGIVRLRNPKSWFDLMPSDRSLVASVAFPVLAAPRTPFTRDPLPSAPIRVEVPPYGFIAVDLLDAAGQPITSPAIAGTAIAPDHESAPFLSSDLSWVAVERGRLIAPVGVGARCGVAVFFLDESRSPMRFAIAGPEVEGATIEKRVTASQLRQCVVGRAVDGLGEPLANQLLRADPELTGTPWSEYPEGWVEGFVCETDSVGNFTIPIPAALPRDVEIHLRFTSQWRRGIRSFGPERTARVRLPIDVQVGNSDLPVGVVKLTTPPVCAAGVVVDTEGKPIPNARITLRYAADAKGNEVRDIAKSDPAGRFEVHHDLQSQEASLIGRAKGMLDSADTPFDRGATDLCITLQPESALTGRIIPPAGRSAREFAVWVEGTASPNWQPGFERNPRRANPGDDGIFHFRGLTSGLATVRVHLMGVEIDTRARGEPLMQVRDIRISEGARATDPRLDPIDLSSRLRETQLSVIDATGRPLENARVRATGSRPDFEEIIAATDARGIAQLCVPSASTHVEVSLDGYRSASIELIATRTQVTLEALPRARLLVVGAIEPGLLVLTQPTDDDEPDGDRQLAWIDAGRQRSDAIPPNGRVEIPLPPGRYALRVMRLRESGPSVTLGSGSVEVFATGNAALEIEISR